MRVVLHAAALRARHGVAVGEPVEIGDALADHYIAVGVAAPFSPAEPESATELAADVETATHAADVPDPAVPEVDDVETATVEPRETATARPQRSKRRKR
jgi:hypothetical protein